MTKYNLKEIMTDAWEKFRSPLLYKRISGRERFSKCLASAWSYAKAIAVSAASKLFYQKQAIAQALMNPIEKLEQEIAMLPYKSSRINIAARRVQLEAQIERLAA